MKRILIIGDKEVGKTTFMNIFLNKQLSERYEATIGVQAGARTIQFEDRSFVNVQVWDTPGQQEYAEMAYPFYSNCKLFVLIGDRMRIETLQSLGQWLKRIQEYNGMQSNTVLIILNKRGGVISSNRSIVAQSKVNNNNNSNLNLKNTSNTNKQGVYSKQTVQKRYEKQLQYLISRKRFTIRIIEIDLMQQKYTMNREYLDGFLEQCFKEQIITESEEKRVDKLGGLIECRNEGCEIM